MPLTERVRGSSFEMKVTSHVVFFSLSRSTFSGH
jgi:hypothetical protein